MWIDPGALERVPGYAVVPEHAVMNVLRELAVGRTGLERAFRRLEREQPALASFVATELSALEAPEAQTLGYFLFLAVCAAFREAFGPRLDEVAEADLDGALETLLADGEVRSRTCPAGTFSQDVIAQWQPALMRLVSAEIAEADGPAGAEAETLLQVLLVLIVALTRAVGA